MGIDFARMAIAVVTWQRPAQLQALVQSFHETAPDYHRIHLIVNHPEGASGFVAPDHRCRVVHSGRPPEHQGCMAKSWNLAMQWAFRDPAVEWLLCAMDDLQVLPGWPTVFEAFDADLYLAPAGDSGFLFNRRTFREVGWFDERFPVIGFQEWDWQARSILRLGINRVSLDDLHGWHHHPVGLSQYWVHQGGPQDRQRTGTYEPINQAWLEQKWGCGVGDMIGRLASGQVPEPRIPEIDWYPWMSRG